MASHILLSFGPSDTKNWISHRPLHMDMDYRGRKTSTLEQDERKRNHFSSCFQWLIKEMKCIMMVMPLHVSLVPRSLMCFFCFSYFEFFILVRSEWEFVERYHNATLTALLWFQNMNAGGSGELCTTQVTGKYMNVSKKLFQKKSL